MKYTKPQIVRSTTAASIIQSSQIKGDFSQVDQQLEMATTPAYEADE
jgi:hypothetical protein